MQLAQSRTLQEAALQVSSQAGQGITQGPFSPQILAYFPVEGFIRNGTGTRYDTKYQY